MEKSKVYFMKEISKENLVKIYDALNVKLSGKVAVKVHSGEEGNQNYLRPEFMQDIVKHVNGTIEAAAEIGVGNREYELKTIWRLT